MAERVRLAAGDLSVEIAPAVGGVVRSFRASGRPVFREGPEEITDANDGGCYPLVPFSNRVRDGRFTFRGREVVLSPNLPPQKHPLHGQGWRGAWDVVSADGARADLRFGHARGEWPWAYAARQVFELTADQLLIRLEVRNEDAEPMPAALGLHPYFPADDATTLDTEVTGVWTIDEEVMPVELVPPTGRYSLRQRRINAADLDNGYEGWSGRAELSWPTHRVRIDALGTARRFQVYSPPEGGMVVAEPVMNANAALNEPEERWSELDLHVLQPGETLSMQAAFVVLPPEEAA